MIENAYYSQELHGPYEIEDIGNLPLEEGGTVRNCKLAYATHGRLNSAKDNAVLVTTWFSGTNKIMEQLYIGPGRALDPEKYFIIIVNQIGSGLSSSPHNTPAPDGMARFPNVRIGDDVRAQHKLLTEKFGITELALVTGASMGAQQTYEWAVRYPDMVKRAAAIAGTAKNTDHDFQFTETLRLALLNDPGFKGGYYKSNEDVHLGLRYLARLMTVMGWSTTFFKKEMWRGFGFNSAEDFVAGFMEAYFLPMDPNDLLAMMWKWQRGDVSRHTGGDLAAALGRIKARTLTMPISTDMFFPPADCQYEAEMIPGGMYRVIQSDCGHLGLFAVEPDYSPQIDRHLNELLETRV